MAKYDQHAGMGDDEFVSTEELAHRNLLRPGQPGEPTQEPRSPELPSDHYAPKH